MSRCAEGRRTQPEIRDTSAPSIINPSSGLVWERDVTKLWLATASLAVGAAVANCPLPPPVVPRTPWRLLRIRVRWR